MEDTDATETRKNLDSYSAELILLPTSTVNTSYWTIHRF